METILFRLESRMEEMAKTLNELKSENEVLRENILGILACSKTESMGFMQSKTLREIVEEMQTALTPKKLNQEDYEAIFEDTNSEGEASATEQIETSVSSTEKYPIVEIRSKTLKQERYWMRDNFTKFIRTKIVKDGASLDGTTVQAISSSIPLPEPMGASCAMKLSNFLNSALTDPQYQFFNNSSGSGPSIVSGNVSEAFSFQGNSYGCSFLCSFAIRRFLRLTIYCFSYSTRGIFFGIGFTPEDVSSDQRLLNTLIQMPSSPDIWIINESSNVPLELCVSHGNLLARGHMTNGPRSVVHVEILETNDAPELLNFSNEGEKLMGDGESIDSILSRGNFEKISRPFENSARFSFIIELENRLKVKLSNRNIFYCNSSNNDLMPSEILPLHRESFVGVDDTNLESMFAYQIDSTDLAFVVAMRVGPDFNAFATAFVQLPAVTDAKEFEDFMDPNQWTKYFYRKYATAKEGLQLIQMRNIRAEIEMTQKEQSFMKIRVFTI